MNFRQILSTKRESTDDRMYTTLGLSSRRDCFLVALLGIVMVIAFSHEQLTKRTCEFATFYVGARLAGTQQLYDKARNKEEQVRAVRASSDAFSYGRLPFYAWFLSPLGKLSYMRALVVWQVLSGIAVVVFIMIWPHREMALVTCGWSLPLLMVFMLGEDDNFLLVILAIVLAIYRRHPWITGLLMSLLAIKFNLFLLLPVLLLGQKRWRMALGFLAGCALLISLSFAVAGLDWPVKMAAVLLQKSILPREYTMPNIRGLLESVTSSLWPELILCVIVASEVYLLVRKGDFEIGMAGMLVGSLLVSHHAGPEDCVMLIPAMLLFGSRVTNSHVVCFCLVLLSPILYAFLLLEGLPSIAAKLTFLALSGVMLLCVVQRNGYMKAENSLTGAHA